MKFSKYAVLILSVLLPLASLCSARADELAVIKTRFGTIKVRFFSELAPKHVESFKKHAKNGYYNGTLFHRVIPGFVIQGGDPYTKDKPSAYYGTGGHAASYYGIGLPNSPESWRLPAEFNTKKHKKGTLSMARAQSIDSAGSQFFICLSDVESLDEKYTVFGEVVQGLNVLDRIASETTNELDRPLTDVAMEIGLVSPPTRGKVGK